MARPLILLPQVCYRLSIVNCQLEKGLAKSIGVSNYNVQCLCNLLSFCKIKPVANEIEFHPYFCQKKLKEFCDKEDIAIISYYPLAHGNGAKEYIKTHNGEMNH